MDKRRLHHTWTRLRRIKPWYFLAIAVVSGLIGAFSLRANNQHMIKLRDAVYAADMNNTDVQTALGQLQAYVTASMNTNLSTGANPVYPPVQLKYTYDRLIRAQTQALANTNAQIYTDAQHYCEQQNSTDFYGSNRVPCITQYVQNHATVQRLPQIPAALYEFDFISPTWSPDLAGWSLVTAILGAILFVISFITDRWFKRHIA